MCCACHVMPYSIFMKLRHLRALPFIIIFYIIIFLFIHLHGSNAFYTCRCSRRGLVQLAQNQNSMVAKGEQKEEKKKCRNVININSNIQFAQIFDNNTNNNEKRTRIMENRLKSDRKGSASERESHMERANVDVTRIHHTCRLESIIFNFI